MKRAQFEDDSSGDDEPFFQLLRAGQLSSALSGDQWSRVLRQSRFAGLTGRVAHHLLVETHAGTPLCPTDLRLHLESSLRVCRAQRAEVLREAGHIDTALSGLGAPVVLLKGAAYAVGNLPAAHGRVFSDIDILVPKSHLAQAESMLMLNGWMSTEISEYNQKYYRQWMHELPPMRHLMRGTVLDVHHTILPETARLHPDPQKLLKAALRLPGTKVLHTLSPVDMLLHSMTHLFLNDDATHALRDLTDLHLLMTPYAPEHVLWNELVPRALELNLERPLFYAVQALTQLMHTPIPAACLHAAQKHSPGPLIGKLMGSIWRQALRAPVPPDRIAARNLALQALYVRGHWLRMPPALLFRHLSIKALGLHERARSPDAGEQNATTKRA